jgi:hypothetical protein
VLLAAGSGSAGITYSPKGLAVAPLGNWGNLRYSANAAFMMLIHASYTKDATVKKNCVEWAQGQVDYMLGLPNRWALWLPSLAASQGCAGGLLAALPGLRSGGAWGVMQQRVTSTQLASQHGHLLPGFSAQSANLTHCHGALVAAARRGVTAATLWDMGKTLLSTCTTGQPPALGHQPAAVTPPTARTQVRCCELYSSTSYTCAG